MHQHYSSYKQTNDCLTNDFKNAYTIHMTRTKNTAWKIVTNNTKWHSQEIYNIWCFACDCCTVYVLFLFNCKTCCNLVFLFYTIKQNKCMINAIITVFNKKFDLMKMIFEQDNVFFFASNHENIKTIFNKLSKVSCEKHEKHEKNNLS